MKTQWMILAASALVIGSGNFAATAQTPKAENPDDALYNRALAAGYKAQFTCSGLWNGGKTVEQIEADELTGIYDRIADIVPTLEADIDQGQKIVSVRYQDGSPPRYAYWNADTGCTSMPIGMATVSNIADKPHDLIDDMQWPMGDANATPMRIQSILPIDRVAGSAFAEGDHAFGKAAFGGNTSAVVIVKDGKIIWEAYKPGFDMHTGQRTWSVAKSIAGTLVGHSVQRGAVNPEDAAPVPGWTHNDDSRRAITLDNLMRMASGLYSDTAGNRTDPVYMGAASVRERTTSWPLLREPGTHFRYSNNDILLSVLATKAADDEFDPRAFFDRIGMTRTYAETDWQGNYILSSQVWTTSRDLARLGLLYLNDGVWTGANGSEERMLPKGWREYVSTPSGPQPESQFGYGATFWLMNRSEGIPSDTFAALGNRGQSLVIIPSLDMIIVRRGYDTAENRFDIEEFTRRIVAAAK